MDGSIVLILCRMRANQIRRGWGGEQPVLASGGGAQKEEGTNEDERQDMSDTGRITMAAAWTNPKTASATKDTTTKMYSKALPVCSVVAQQSNFFATWP